MSKGKITMTFANVKLCLSMIKERFGLHMLNQV
jgi:hypothetical protein